MDTIFVDAMPGFINFMIYFCSSMFYMLLFCAIYCWITPYDELKLIRDGMLAPAISFGGATIGFVLPLASAISHSQNYYDMLLWAGIAMVIQIIFFQLVRLFFRGMVKDIAEDKIPSATLLAFLSIAIGLLNAASITY